MEHKVPRGTIYTKNSYYYSRISYYVDGKRKTKGQATGITIDNSSKRKSDRQERAALRIMQENLDEFIAQQIRNELPARNQMITDTAQAWLTHTCKSKAPGTIASYTNIVRDITLYFTEHPVRTTDLTSSQVEAYLDWERQRRQPNYSGENKVQARFTDGSGIENTVHHRYTVLRSILQYAVRERIIDRNVASKRDAHIQPPSPQRQEFDVLSQTEALELIQHLAQEPLWFQISVLLGLLLGLRRSEIVGIRLSDINWDINTLTIHRTATQQTLNHKTSITIKPFTKNRRPKVLSLSCELCNSLIYYISEQQKCQDDFGPGYQHNWDEYLMRYPDGKLVPPNTITQHFQIFLRKHNLKKIRFHDLRHSCASILFASGVDILTIQEILGHAQLTTTILYTHQISSNKSKALTAMSNQFLPPVSVEGKKDDKK